MMAQPPVNFALYPGVAVQGIIDLGTTKGRKYFEQATKKVSKELYDATPEGLYGFIKNVENHARKFGWLHEHSGIFWIPRDIDNPNEGNFTNLSMNYGEIKYDHLKHWEQTYLNEQVCKAQDSVQPFYAFWTSLSKSGLKKINVHEKEYMIEGTPSGMLLWKIILQESHLDTNVTALSIRTMLRTGALTEYIEEVSYDITKFNQHVLMLLQSLQACGEMTSDLLTNLFTTYATVKKDEDFKVYIAQKKSEYKDDEKEYTHTRLMELAENKYKNLVISNTWSHESYKDKIMALMVEQEKTSKELEWIKHKKSEPGKNSGGGKGTGGQSEKGGQVFLDWMYKHPPKDQLTKTRMYDKKEWWYCLKKTGRKCEPGQYHHHKPSECQGMGRKRSNKLGKNGKGNDKKEEGKAEQGSTQHKLKVAQALLNIQTSDNESNSE